ncbi:hypothetical protein Misp01_36170 [Microtetraspora sp. NBRC 13810]|nr:hypothetical protein Misp01_36170 [Microtetraspora sp. NBRC 13810]
MPAATAALPTEMRYGSNPRKANTVPGNDPENPTTPSAASALPRHTVRDFPA